MLIIDTLPLGDYQTNCYIVRREDSRKALILDPGYEPEIILSFLEENHLTPEAIALTHGHFDHVGGVEKLMEAFPGLPVYLHEADTRLDGELSHGLRWTDTYGEGDTLPLDSVRFQVLHTPGHTPGSVCLRAGDVLLTGDTLFAGSCGRTDFPGGSWAQMMASLGRLVKLEGNLQVLPGHGEPTTLEAERASNPYVREGGT